MPFETLQRVLGEEAEPDWVHFQSVVFVNGVLLRVDVECFLDSPLQTVTFAIDHFYIVEIKSMLFEDRMLSSSRHVRGPVCAPRVWRRVSRDPPNSKISSTLLCHVLFSAGMGCRENFVFGLSFLSLSLYF